MRAVSFDTVLNEGSWLGLDYPYMYAMYYRYTIMYIVWLGLAINS